jgi:hypothetical protein
MLWNIVEYAGIYWELMEVLLVLYFQVDSIFRYQLTAEVERLFSSAKLMLPPSRNHLAPDAIEAGECIRSWRKNGLV